MGSKVKPKHLVLLQKKVREKIDSLQEQLTILVSTVSDYVAQAESRADRLLATSDSHMFMEQYLDVMQELDRSCNTCMLLTAQANDMIENAASEDDQSAPECPQSKTDKPQEGKDEEECPLSSSPGFDRDNDTMPTRCMVKCDQDMETVIQCFDGQLDSVEPSLDERREKGSLRDCFEGDQHLETREDNLSLSLENRGNNSSNDTVVCRRDSVISESARSEDERKMESAVSREDITDPNISLDVSAIPEQGGIFGLPCDHVDGDSVSRIESSLKTIPPPPVKDDKSQPNMSAPPTPVKNERSQPTTSALPTPVKDDRSQPIMSAPPTPCKSMTADSSIAVTAYGGGPSISHCTLTEGPVIPVIVSEIATPWAFYVQQYGLALDKLRTSINLFQARLQPGEATIDEPRAGMVCLACFSADGLFYRAKIIRVSEIEGDVVCDVIYVDYGNCESVSSSRLLQLPTSLAQLPSQAIFCSLSGVSPVNKLGLWTEDEINGFRQHVTGLQLNCKATFVSTQQTLSFPHLIELYLNIPIQQTDSKIGRVLISQVSLAAILVKRNFARPVPVSEQIAKLQNQFGELPTPSSSKSSSPQKTLKGEKGKHETEEKEADVVMESIEIVYPRSSHSHTCEGVADTQVTSVIRPVVSGNGQGVKPKVKQALNSKEQITVSTECDPFSQSGKQKHSMKGTKKSGSKEKYSEDVESLKLAGNSDSSGDRSPCKSHDTSCLEGETTTSGITDMSLNPVSAEYPSTPAEEYDVMIAHIISPNDFYVHKITEDVGKTLDRLMKDLNLHFERQSRKRLHKLYRSFTPKVDSLCCAQFSHDNCYYRGQIIGVKVADGEASRPKEERIGKVHVFYIDFGDREWLPRSKVFPLPEEFSCFPPLTVWCTLAHVLPVSGQWTERSVQEFERLAGGERRLSLCVREGKLPESNRCVVQSAPIAVFLVDVVNSEEEVCINLELMRTGHATLIVSNEMDSPKDESDLDDDPVDLEWNQDTWDPLVEDYISLRNSYNIDVDDAGVATVGYKAQDEKRICKYFNNPGQCWRGDYCPYKHVQNAGITGDQEYVFVLEDDQMDLLPDEGTMVAVEITSILSPRHFYLTLPFGKTPVDQLRNKQEDEDDHEETLEDLVRSMKATYQNRSFSHRDITLLAPGQAVAAKYVSGSEIGWYRAKVTDISPEEEQVEVYFVDFGHTEWVKEVDIHNLEPEFLHLPQQAVECFLVDIEPAGQEMQWSEESRNKFRDMVDGRTLVAQIRTRSWSGCLHVDLYDTSGQVDINIAEALIRAGYAQRPQTEAAPREHRAVSPDIILVPG